ncbi:hypothetical protein CERZMDRAFT_92771 [Cercospora zeae-maydis SCOH1-5]|uniref:Uncharacterized protein n=1 Tax=Cercospora zeae-maydis SCOH1-5 TaxID=717836 RepID=A0A6A6FTJ8_9PEZI|nr:hypothetical protein CERZMDRAFT_92771 [Cercospora zeae-maydis SCOH1-5]
MEAGANVNAKYRGKTPIHVALEQGYFDGYQKPLAMLLAAGAALNVPDPTGESPLTKLFKGSAGDVPLEDYQKECLALIFHPKVQSTVDANAMAANQWRGKLSDQQERMLRYLLDAERIDLDAKGGTLGRTALHHAAAAGCAVALDLLLESGADKTVQDKDGKDALSILGHAGAGLSSHA